MEITDINKIYLERKELAVELLSRGTAWLDTGTHESLLNAGIFIKVVEDRQGLKIACPEEIAWRMQYIDDAALDKLADGLGKSSYGSYLKEILRDRTLR